MTSLSVYFNLSPVALEATKFQRKTIVADATTRQRVDKHVEVKNKAKRSFQSVDHAWFPAANHGLHTTASYCDFDTCTIICCISVTILAVLLKAMIQASVVVVRSLFITSTMHSMPSHPRRGELH